MRERAVALPAPLAWEAARRLLIDITGGARTMRVRADYQHIIIIISSSSSNIDLFYIHMYMYIGIYIDIDIFTYVYIYVYIDVCTTIYIDIYI